MIQSPGIHDRINTSSPTVEWWHVILIFVGLIVITIIWALLSDMFKRKRKKDKP